MTRPWAECGTAIVDDGEEVESIVVLRPSGLSDESWGRIVAGIDALL